MGNHRKKIPKKIADEVMTKSMGKCYCDKKGDNIHHIDEDPSNNDFDNLVLLCYVHHNDASIKNGLSRQLTIDQLKKLRNDLYKHNEEKRRIELRHYSKTLKTVTDESLYRAALDASITIEIIKLRSGYTYGDWEKASEMLSGLEKYADYTSARIANEVFDFLASVANYTRHGTSCSMASSISYSIMSFFPHPQNAVEKRMCEELSNKCCSIAHSIAYDAFIYLHNMAIAYSGLEILKFLYRLSTELNLPKIRERVMFTYSELEFNLNRPEKNNLDTAKLFLAVMKNDIATAGIDLPDTIPSDLYALYEEHQGKSED